MPRGGTRKRVCRKCGTILEEGHYFCPKCGTKYEVNASDTEPTISQPTSQPISQPVQQTMNVGAQPIPRGTQETAYLNHPTPVSAPVPTPKKRTGFIISVLIGVGAILIGIGLFLLIRGKQVSEVSLNRESISLVEGKKYKLVCTVSPDDAKSKTVTWKSSNESVAKVDSNGQVTAVSEGTCTITVTSNNGKYDECKVIVEKAGPDFKDIYNKYCDSDWAYYGSDGSYLSVDTTPQDWDDHMEIEAYYALSNINKVLGLPDSLLEEMGQTTWSMGKQTETFESAGVTVSWTYHPDKGLEVTYKLINK
jgi:hypothetical protein